MDGAAGRVLYEELAGCSQSLCGGGDKGQGKENKHLWGYWATSHLAACPFKEEGGNKGSQEVVHVAVACNHAMQAV